MPNIVKNITYQKIDANGKVLEESYEEHMQGPTSEELQDQRDKAMIEQLANPLPIENFMKDSVPIKYDSDGNVIEDEEEE